MRYLPPMPAFLCILISFLLIRVVPAPAQMEDLEKEFFQDQGTMEQEYKSFEQSAFEEFRREVEAMWNDFATSTKKDWVEYSGDKTGRSRVDFEQGEVVVEVLVPAEEAKKNPAAIKERLTKEIERLAVDKGKNRDYPLPAKARAVEQEDILAAPFQKVQQEEQMIPPATLLPEPVLDRQLKTKAGKPVTKETKEKFAQEVVEEKPIVKEVLDTPQGKLIKAQVSFPLVPNHLRIRGEKHLATVRAQAERFRISVPLAFAIIHTESYFNPKATSKAPAYGLMQLVPRSGGREAYRVVYSKDRVLAPEYLYQPNQNIELGCAYLGHLKNHYFRKVRNPTNALYCAVASYNTGPGNLSRAITGKRRLAGAIDGINAMGSEELYSRLRKHLPYAETRDYLKKVRDRMPLYEEWR